MPKMKKIKISILIIFILFFSFTTFWYFKNFQKSLSKFDLSEIKLPKFEIPLELLKKEGEKEFITPDKRLKIKYPADWLEIEEKSLKEIRGGAQILFFAQKIAVEGEAFASLIIQESDKKEGQSLEKIIEEIKNEAEKRGEEIEVTKLEIGEKIASFEAIQKKENYSLFSKNKLILLDKKVYIISFITLEKDWPKFSKEADSIFNSLEIF